MPATFINISGAETEQIWFIKLKTMAADNLDSCVARTTVAMLLATQVKHVIILNEKGSEVYVSLHCRERKFKYIGLFIFYDNNK